MGSLAGVGDIAIMIVQRYPPQRIYLLDILWDIHREVGYVSAADAVTIADWLGLSPEDVVETASFYHFFHTNPAGRHRIYLSNSTIAILNGYQQVRRALEQHTGVHCGGAASADFGIYEVSCIGASDHEPAMLIDDVIFTDLTPESVGKIIEGLREGKTAQQIANPEGLACDGMAYIEMLTRTKVHTCGPVFFHDGTDSEAADLEVLHRCRKLNPDDVISVIQQSGLRGRGGAGFPTGTKWALCRSAVGAQKYIICNADEGEPGTFKDRALLTYAPQQVLMGMAIAAHAVGAKQGILYLRAEYAYMQTYLQRQLTELRAQAVLGDDFDIRIQLGAGAYICGEESALIESCEGKRGTPRLKPPFPVERGFLGMPTVVNNVETFAAVSQIMKRGAQWFAAMGVPGSAGTRLLSVSGDCTAPGIYEMPWGVTIAEILNKVGAQRPCAVQTSGPSGEVISVAAEAHRRLSYDDVACNGSFMVFNDERDLLEIVTGYMRFFAHESCGICLPCRFGTGLLADTMAVITAGRGTRRELDAVASYSEIISRTSRCGLGVSAPNSIVNTIKKFPEFYADRLCEDNNTIRSSFDVEASLTAHGEAVADLAPQELL